MRLNNAWWYDLIWNDTLLCMTCPARCWREATLLAALKQAKKHAGQEGSKKVFLTCLGGGVFGNSMDPCLHFLDQKQLVIDWRAVPIDEDRYPGAGWHRYGQSPFFMANSSTSGQFSTSMLVYPRVPGYVTASKPKLPGQGFIDLECPTLGNVQACHSLLGCGT